MAPCRPRAERWARPSGCHYYDALALRSAGFSWVQIGMMKEFKRRNVAKSGWTSIGNFIAFMNRSEQPGDDKRPSMVA
jgi:hypothetical protein